MPKNNVHAMMIVLMENNKRKYFTYSYYLYYINKPNKVP